jgi:hypothetical protein
LIRARRLEEVQAGLRQVDEEIRRVAERP